MHGSCLKSFSEFLKNLWGFCTFEVFSVALALISNDNNLMLQENPSEIDTRARL